MVVGLNHSMADMFVDVMQLTEKCQIKKYFHDSVAKIYISFVQKTPSKTHCKQE